MTNSREKGKRIERAFASMLTDHGFHATRGQQHKGGPDSPDVDCRSLPWFHFEVKGGKQLRLKDFMAQAQAEADDGSLPVVAWREDRQPWMVIMEFKDWIELVRGSNYVDPHCDKAEKEV